MYEKSLFIKLYSIVSKFFFSVKCWRRSSRSRCSRYHEYMSILGKMVLYTWTRYRFFRTLVFPAEVSYAERVACLTVNVFAARWITQHENGKEVTDDEASDSLWRSLLSDWYSGWYGNRRKSWLACSPGHHWRDSSVMRLSRASPPTAKDAGPSGACTAGTAKTYAEKAVKGLTFSSVFFLIILLAIPRMGSDVTALFYLHCMFKSPGSGFGSSLNLH